MYAETISQVRTCVFVKRLLPPAISLSFLNRCAQYGFHVLKFDTSIGTVGIPTEIQTIKPFKRNKRNLDGVDRTMHGVIAFKSRKLYFRISRGFYPLSGLEPAKHARNDHAPQQWRRDLI